MTFWSGETIDLNASAAGSILIQPYDKKQIDCASYKLSMGSETYVTPEKRDTLLRPYGKKKKLSQGEEFLIPPGQFAFLLTNETLEMPKDVIGFISLRTEKKYMGLINVSGFHVDPGFQGKLVFAVYNAGPIEIVLKEGERLFLIWFASLDNPKTKQNRIDRGEQPLTEISSKLVQNMRGHPITLQRIAQEFDAMKTRIAILTGVLGAIVTLSIILLAAFAVPWDWVGAFCYESYQYFHHKGDLQSGGLNTPVTNSNGASTAPPAAAGLRPQAKSSP